MQGTRQASSSGRQRGKSIIAGGGRGRPSCQVERRLSAGIGAWTLPAEPHASSPAMQMVACFIFRALVMLILREQFMQQRCTCMDSDWTARMREDSSSRCAASLACSPSLLPSSCAAFRASASLSRRSCAA